MTHRESSQFDPPLSYQKLGTFMHMYTQYNVMLEEGDIASLIYAKKKMMKKPHSLEQPCVLIFKFSSFVLFFCSGRRPLLLLISQSFEIKKQFFFYITSLSLVE